MITQKHLTDDSLDQESSIYMMTNEDDDLNIMDDSGYRHHLDHTIDKESTVQKSGEGIIAVQNQHKPGKFNDIICNLSEYKPIYLDSQPQMQKKPEQESVDEVEEQEKSEERCEEKHNNLEVQMLDHSRISAITSDSSKRITNSFHSSRHSVGSQPMLQKIESESVKEWNSKFSYKGIPFLNTNSRRFQNCSQGRMNPGPGYHQQVDNINKKGSYLLSTNKNTKSYSLYQTPRRTTAYISSGQKDSYLKPNCDSPKGPMVKNTSRLSPAPGQYEIKGGFDRLTQSKISNIQGCLMYQAAIKQAINKSILKPADVSMCSYLSIQSCSTQKRRK